MVEEASNVIGFGPSALWIFLGVAVALVTIALLALNLITKIKELRKPRMANERTVEEKLRNDNERLTRLEDTTREQEAELKLILRSQIAMIHHMIDGNGVDRLKETQRDIEEFLITGKIKKEA